MWHPPVPVFFWTLDFALLSRDAADNSGPGTRSRPVNSSLDFGFFVKGDAAGHSGPGTRSRRVTKSAWLKIIDFPGKWLVAMVIFWHYSSPHFQPFLLPVWRHSPFSTNQKPEKSNMADQINLLHQSEASHQTRLTLIMGPPLLLYRLGYFAQKLNKVLNWNLKAHSGRFGSRSALISSAWHFRLSITGYSVAG